MAHLFADYIDAVTSGRLKTLEPLLSLFSYQGKPMTLKRHFQLSPMYSLLMPTNSVYQCGRQVAKCINARDLRKLRGSLGERINRLQPGQGVNAFNGTSTESSNITHIFEPSVKPELRLTTRTGSCFGGSGDHRLLTSKGYKRIEDLVVGDKLVKSYSYGKFADVDVDRRRIIATAYMIGDGCCETRWGKNICVHKGNLEVMKDIRSSFPEEWYSVLDYDYTSAYRVNWLAESKVPTWLTEDGRIMSCHNKFIPNWVYTLSRTDTITFIERLWATDGTIKDHDGHIDLSFTSVSEHLVDDLGVLLAKFGILTSKGSWQPSTSPHRAYRLRVEGRRHQHTFCSLFKVPGKPAIELATGPSQSNRDTIPRTIVEPVLRELFHGISGLVRKHKVRVTPRYALSRAKGTEYLHKAAELGLTDTPAYIQLETLVNQPIIYDEVVKIDQLPPTEMFDIEVATHHNFIIDGIVSHNSFGIAEKGILLSGFMPDFHTLYVQPRFDQIKRFNTAIVQPLLRSIPPSLRNDLIEKQQIGAFLMRNFKGSNSIMYMEFCLISPDRTRGISGVSHVFYDEVQDLDLDNMEIIGEVMSATINYGFSQYTGTPKTTDGALSVLFDRSSQGYWIIPCTCGYHNLAHPDAELFKMIGKWDDNLKTGIHCVKCDKGLDTRMGYFKHFFPDRRPDFPGYHVGQITHPLHCALQAKWKTLLYKYNNYTKAKFYNEIAGVPCDESVKLLTIKDIEAASNDIEPTMEAALKVKGYYNMIVMGVDWSGGGALGKSFTAGAILGCRPGVEKLDCIHAFRLPMGMQPEDEAAVLLRYMNEFNCQFMAHDYTGAGYLREVVLNQSGIQKNKLVPFTYAFVPKKDIISVHAPSDGARSSYILDKARSLALMCGLIRGKMLTLPKMRAKDDHPVITDLLALIEDPKEMPRGGIAYMIQRSPDRPDDFAHALNMASSAIWKVRGGYPQVMGLGRYEMSASTLKEIDPFMAQMLSGS